MSKKSLGQHWLNDNKVLDEIIEVSGISEKDTVIEIGPGQGVLTRELIKYASNVLVIEIDEELASHLSDRLDDPINLEIVIADFLEYDLSKIDKKYKVVANIPYFISGKIIRKFLDTNFQPEQMTLLLQKEVAQRLAATPGKTSVLTILTNHYYDVELFSVVPAESFDPPPKVDSQIVLLKKKQAQNKVSFMILSRLVRTAFSSRRKKLTNNLSPTLISKDVAYSIFRKVGLEENVRAQELSMQQWYELAESIEKEGGFATAD